MTTREELEFELAAIEGAMVRAVWRVEWEKLKEIQDKLRNKLEELE